MRVLPLPWRRVYALTAIVLAGCNAVGTSEDYPACAPLSEFGNYGCFGLVVVLDGPAQPWPTNYRWSVWAQSVDTTLRITALGPDPVNGTVTFDVILLRPLPQNVDTASFWVIARFLDDPRPIVVGVPLPVLVADSALYLGRFGPVSGAAHVDTIRLKLGPLSR